MLRYLLLLASVPLLAAELSILPGSVTLSGPESYQQLIAEANLDNHQEDLTGAAKWTSSNSSVATVDQNGMVRPVSDGEAVITAAAQGRTATVTVQIKDAHAAHTWSFRNDVIPVMSKAG